jgi:NAD(P)-dependent dehydrogenase (short-subunit alcohol dehydrogenase family)
VTAADAARYPDLAGKVALVTGGSRGIGAATAKALAANEVSVAVNGRDEEAIDGVVRAVADAGGTAIGVPADVCDWAATEAMRERVEGELGPVDVLVPFAGGFGGMTPVHEISEEEWHSVIESNLTSTFLTVKSFLPGMIERRGGAIITMASNAARFLDIKLTASYAAAKAGIAMFTRHVALEAGEHNIRVNCVAPATTLSERVQRIMPDERRAEIAAMSPLGRLGSPEDTAMATVFLASESAGWLTGVTLDVAGGRIML